LIGFRRPFPAFHPGAGPGSPVADGPLAPCHLHLLQRLFPPWSQGRGHSLRRRLSAISHIFPGR
jgi:hypothetical protein